MTWTWCGNCVGLACLYDGSDELTEPSTEDIAAFEASRQRLYMEQVLLLHQPLMSLVEGQRVSVEIGYSCLCLFVCLCVCVVSMLLHYMSMSEHMHI